MSYKGIGQFRMDELPDLLGKEKMNKGSAIKIGVTVVAAAIPPAISPDVLRWVRVTFNTVGIQDPLHKYGGDISFFVVLTVFFLLPWILALSIKFTSIPFPAAILPWAALISIWFFNKMSTETTSYQFWIAYLGYFAAGLGLAACQPSSPRWQQAEWIPPLIFLAAGVMGPLWGDVFFE